MIDLADSQSPRQHVSLVRHPEVGLVLTLDGATQFTEECESRYHESLGVVPMLFCKPESVFIGGGGDGLVAARLLKFPEVKRIVLCDYDPLVTELARTHADLVALNSGSLSDPRVTVINEDAFQFLETTDEEFGLIICDFPDPVSEELGRLYSQSFYELARRRLSSDGVICIQTLMAEQSRALIQSTVRSVFPHTLFYRTYYSRMGMTGFTLGGKRPLKRIRLTPSWTRYLDESVVDTLFVTPRDESRETDEVNTIENGILSRVTLLAQYWHIASQPYQFNPRYRVIYLDQDNACPQGLLPTFVRRCHEVHPLILYVERAMHSEYQPLLDELGYRRRGVRRLMSYRFVPSNRQRVNQWWQRLNNNSVSEVEAFYCQTNENPEIAILFQDYLERYSDRFFEIDENHHALSHRRLHLVARDRNGRAVMLVALHLGNEIMCEMIHGRSSARQNMLALLLCLRFFEREYGGKGFSFEAADENSPNVMIKLGADQEGRYDVYTR